MQNVRKLFSDWEWLLGCQTHLLYQKWLWRSHTILQQDWIIVWKYFVLNGNSNTSSLCCFTVPNQFLLLLSLFLRANVIFLPFCLKLFLFLCIFLFFTFKSTFIFIFLSYFFSKDTAPNLTLQVSNKEHHNSIKHE